MPGPAACIKGRGVRSRTSKPARASYNKNYTAMVSAFVVSPALHTLYCHRFRSDAHLAFGRICEATWLNMVHTHATRTCTHAHRHTPTHARVCLHTGSLVAAGRLRVRRAARTYGGGGWVSREPLRAANGGAAGQQQFYPGLRADTAGVQQEPCPGLNNFARASNVLLPGLHGLTAGPPLCCSGLHDLRPP
eukprot:1160341-Pelagomonas_calceolata.AAC.1